MVAINTVNPFKSTEENQQGGKLIAFNYFGNWYTK